jgi:hypothetical protein
VVLSRHTPGSQFQASGFDGVVDKPASPLILGNPKQPRFGRMPLIDRSCEHVGKLFASNHQATHCRLNEVRKSPGSTIDHLTVNRYKSPATTFIADAL